MANLNQVFRVIRVISLGVVSLFAVLVLILAALVTNFTESTFEIYFTYAAYAFAVSGLTLFTVPAMIGLSLSRKGAFVSMIVVELAWLALLWILWLALGGTIANISLVAYCTELGLLSSYQSACIETQAMAAFAFLNWLLLLVHNIFLLSLAIVQANRGNSAIWTSCVTDVDFSASASTEPKVGYANTPMTATPGTQTYPPQQHYDPQLQQLQLEQLQLQQHQLQQHHLQQLQMQQPGYTTDQV